MLVMKLLTSHPRLSSICLSCINRVMILRTSEKKRTDILTLHGRLAMNADPNKRLERRVAELERQVRMLMRVPKERLGTRDPDYIIEDDFVEMHEADNHFDAFRIKGELIAALSQSSINYLELTFENYPEAARYKVYQNHLIQETKLTDADRKKLAKTRYLLASEAEVGDVIECPGCGTKIAKKTYQHRFCSHKIVGQSTCKDFINNWFNPKRLERTLKWLES
ncbi:hypothetical protein VPHK571_0294 [Vibrio phage K571]